MRQIHLVKFKNRFCPPVTDHWCIFLQDETAGNNAHGIPISGTLFHAAKNCSGGNGLCCINNTVYMKGEVLLSESESLRSSLELTGAKATEEQVDHACLRVSQNRSFNLVTRNCQEWVIEVLKDLIGQNLVPSNALQQMKLEGYSTLAETCQDSSFKSLSWIKSAEKT
jgi:hypothetical protein